MDRLSFLLAIAVFTNRAIKWRGKGKTMSSLSEDLLRLNVAEIN